MLANSPSDDHRHGYLLGQPLWRARYNTANQAWQLAVHEVEPQDESTKLASGFRPPVNSNDHSFGNDVRWVRCPRAELVRLALESPDWHRVGLVCGAGLGKTTTLQWLETALNRPTNPPSPVLAFFRELECFPENVEDLVDEIANKLATTTGLDHTIARQEVIRLRACGQIILLLDSLDQANPDPKGPAVRALKALDSGQWSKCRQWVSGRPYAFRVAEHALRKGQPNTTWQFIRVGQLDEPECRQLLETTGLTNLPRPSYPRPHRFDDLNPAGHRLARVPRYGRLMALLPREQYARLTSEAATFWELYQFVAVHRDDATGLLDDGLKATSACLLGWHHPAPPPTDHHFRKQQVRLAHDILGALAFEMFTQVQQNSKPHPLFTIERDLSTFVTNVRNRLVRAGAYLNNIDEPISPQLFTEDWKRLLAMDSHGLKNFIFAADGRDEKLRWTDISTAAYFAASWACRWGAEQEWQHTRRWIVDPATNENEVFREFWQMALDLPRDGVNEERWRDLFSPLYQRPTDSNQLPIRSTEFIYRSWERMHDTPAQNAYRNDPACLPLVTNQTWLNGLISLAHPDSVLPNDTGTFTMGAPADEDPEWDMNRGNQDNPQHPVRLTAYRLHQFCVTNAEYELFDPRHQGQRWDGTNKHPFHTPEHPNGDDVYPVVNVSWYDAWCFTRWLGAVEIDGCCYTINMPTEAQWEYACRAGQSTPFTFTVSHSGTSVTPDVCNFDGNIPFPSNTSTKHVPADQLYRAHTIGVADLAPNRWGFYQMHGNVWEWCTDWYLTTFYLSEDGHVQNPTNDFQVTKASARVLRGGGWLNYGWRCR